MPEVAIPTDGSSTDIKASTEGFTLSEADDISASRYLIVWGPDNDGPVARVAPVAALAALAVEDPEADVYPILDPE